MIIVAGYSRWKGSEERDASVAAFAAMVERARLQDGCIDMSITADTVDPTRSNILEIWRDDAAWKAWRKVAKGPRSRPSEVTVSVYGAQVEKSF
jgi:quinol monooxygenase YgiN